VVSELPSTWVDGLPRTMRSKGNFDAREFSAIQSHNPTAVPRAFDKPHVLDSTYLCTGFRRDCLTKTKSMLGTIKSMQDKI
jgi:hypothetical protein